MYEYIFVYIVLPLIIIIKIINFFVRKFWDSLYNIHVFYIGCSVEFILKVGVEESIVNAL
jgi:hypothetical protein